MVYTAPSWDGLPDRTAFIRKWREAGVYGDLTLAAAIDQGAERFGDSRMIFHSESHPAEATLSELHARSLRLAGAFHALGLRQGDVIALQVPNWIEGILAYQAAMQIGAVLVPIVHFYGPAEVSYILKASGARFLIMPDRWRNIDYMDRLSKLDLAQVERVIIIGERSDPRAISWSQLAELETTDFPRSAAGADDPCVLIYTSGTTSSPKGVVHTHNTLIAANRMYDQLGGVSPVTLAAGPAGHIGGVLSVVRLVLSGGDTIMLDVWDAEAAARLIHEHKIPQSNLMPFFLATTMEAADKLGVSLSWIKRCMVGATSVPPTLIERAETYGIWACRAYGSTEVCTVTAAYDGDSMEKRAYTDGRATPGAAIRCVDDDGADVPLGEDGEVAVLAPFMALGYHQAEHNRNAFTPDGWFRSGDIGRLDAEGFLTITDRKKDIIIRGGENISSKEVEDVLARHPAVFESAVLSMPDPVMGERVCAFVVTRGAQSLDLSEVQAHFRQAGVARQKTPEHVVLVAELPRTVAGKVKKFELREQLRRLAEEEGRRLAASAADRRPA
jgi:acyl-CoA synthetase (AMP-forming)/AMP-acid ligase II